MKKVAFIFKEGRVSRLKKRTSYPVEFFYGYFELKKKFKNISIIEDKEIGMSAPLPFLAKVLNKLSFFFPEFPFGFLLPLLKNDNINKLNRYDTLIVTTNALGLVLGLGKKLSLIKSKVVFITMGLVNLKMKSWQIKLIKYFTDKTFLITISKSEKFFLSKILNRSIDYIPFGVDTYFWKPKKAKIEEEYILSIGNDRNRDWETLIRAWSPKFPNLKIISNHSIKTAKANIEIINSNWNKQIFSDDDILRLYNDSYFVIIPLKNTIQPAGQSVCLQAMACSKLVVISEIDGIWDKENLIKNKHLIYVKPMNSKFLNQKIKMILSEKDTIANISKISRDHVKKNFTIKIFSKSFEKILKHYDLL